MLGSASAVLEIHLGRRQTSEVQKAVREHYAAAATKLSDGAGCFAGYCDQDLIQISLTQSVSLGCGNPTALAPLQAGETVLDLGSGGGRCEPTATDGHIGSRVSRCSRLFRVLAQVSFSPQPASSCRSLAGTGLGDRTCRDLGNDRADIPFLPGRS